VAAESWPGSARVRHEATGADGMAESRISGQTSSRTSRGQADVRAVRAQGRAPDISGCQAGRWNRFAKLAPIDSNGASTAKGPETTLCQSLNTSAKNAIISSKRSSSASSGRNAPSATRPSLILSFRCSRFRRKGRLEARRLPEEHLPEERAVPAAIPAGRAPARLAIWIEGCSGFGFRVAGCGGSFRVPCRSLKPRARCGAYALGSVLRPM